MVVFLESFILSQRFSAAQQNYILYLPCWISKGQNSIDSSNAERSTPLTLDFSIISFLFPLSIKHVSLPIGIEKICQQGNCNINSQESRGLFKMASWSRRREWGWRGRRTWRCGCCLHKQTNCSRGRRSCGRRWSGHWCNLAMLGIKLLDLTWSSLIRMLSFCSLAWFFDTSAKINDIY